jgi:putative DNA primase/helicase
MSALRTMAAALGGDVAGASILCPGPGHSPRDRSMQVSLSSTASDGFIVRSFASDHWQDCRDHVKARLGMRLGERGARNHAPRSAARAPVTRPADREAMAVALWESAKDPRCTRVARYLERRSLDLTNDMAGRVVRYHEACPWRGEAGEIERRPAMLTAFRLIATDRLVAVHRTLISDDGEKIDRRMLGPVAGAAIKIDDDSDVEQGLHICEGFETGLAGRMLGFRPVWALGSAGAIAEFSVLPGIDALTILAETDDSGANEKARRLCGNRWAAANREILIATPRVAGDMNDALQS